MTPDAIGGRPARHLAGHIAQGLVIAALSAGLFWVVWIYGNGLRDPRYLDGWVLALGIGVQLAFHLAVKTARLSPKSAMRWRKMHVFLGYLLIAAFLSHADVSLPDTGFEWALWATFLLVTLSGILGAGLAWSRRTKGRIGEGIGYDRIPALRAALARDVEAVVARAGPAADQFALPGLPALPHDAWIADLYANRLHDFFGGPRHFAAHLVGSQRPLNALTGEIDSLSRYVDPRGRERLAAIRSLVIEKDRLDFAQLHLGLTRGLLFVHVPATYALVVLSVVHVLAAYAFSSGAW